MCFAFQIGIQVTKLESPVVKSKGNQSILNFAMAKTTVAENQKNLSNQDHSAALETSSGDVSHGMTSAVTAESDNMDEKVLPEAIHLADDGDNDIVERQGTEKPLQYVDK